ncbi:MAG: site-specific integrase, partial [bacterium]
MSIRSRSTRAGRVYEVRLRGPDGREVSRTLRTKREAVQYVAGLRTSKAKGTWLDPRESEVTLGDLATEWLASNPAKRRSSRA